VQGDAVIYKLSLNTMTGSVVWNTLVVVGQALLMMVCAPHRLSHCVHHCASHCVPLAVSHTVSITTVPLTVCRVPT
jgi:fumarate reductase subunit D